MINCLPPRCRPRRCQLRPGGLSGHSAHRIHRFATVANTHCRSGGKHGRFRPRLGLPALISGHVEQPQCASHGFGGSTVSTRIAMADASPVASRPGVVVPLRRRSAK